MNIYTNSWEVDGKTTITKHQKKDRADMEKDFLEEWGYKVIRKELAPTTVGSVWWIYSLPKAGEQYD